MTKKFLELFNKCDERLKQTALTHSSYAHDKNIDSNERLEFLGDSVLQIIVSGYLYKHYHKDEGRMTKIRAAFVCTEYLATLAKDMNIMPMLKLGKSIAGKPVSDAILADAIECMIATMYLSFGLNKISDTIIECLDIKQKLKIGFEVKDYKSILLEFCQNNKKKVKYEITDVETSGGQSTFRATIFVDKEFVAYGQGSTKKVAEQNAAKLAYNKLTKVEV